VDPHQLRRCRRNDHPHQVVAVNRIPDSRIINWATDLQTIAAQIAYFIGDTTLTHPAASLKLTQALQLISDAHMTLRDTAEWPATVAEQEIL